MAEPAIPLPVFCKRLLAGDPSLLEKPVSVAPREDDKAVPLKVLGLAERGATGNPLIITFHGALDRKKQAPPFFEGAEIAQALAGSATLVAIADPMLQTAPDLSVAWFLGNEKLDLPSFIALLLDGLVKAVSPSRVIFCGLSTGAHAALTHSHRFPDSLCLLVNPLGRVSDYGEAAVNLYVERCWPGLGRRQVIVARRTDDAGSAYRTGYDNKVLILQNATDSRFRNGALSLLNNLRRAARFMLISEFFPNLIGHTYPRALLVKWTCAAVTAPAFTLRDIANEALGRKAAPATSPAPERVKAE